MLKKTDELRVPQKETFIWRRISDGIIEVEGSTTHFLNPPGAKIWELINERNTVADIIRIILGQNRGSEKREEELRLWVKEFLDDLEEKSLISYETGIWDDS